MSQNQNTPELRFEGFTEPWKGRKFGEEFLFLHNNTLSRAELCDADGDVFDVHYGDVLIKYSSVIDITKANLPRIIDAGKVSGCDSLHNGDVVIADTAEDETAGKCTELRGIDNEKVFSGLHTIPCRPRRIYASGFLGHYLNSRAFRKQLFPMMQGTKVVSISKTSMASTCLTVPSIEEQVTISEILSSIDSLIVLHQRKYERLQHLKQALLQKMFPKPGELVPELRFDGFAEPWEERKLGEIGEVKTGNTPSTANENYYSKKGTPWITPTDIRENGTYSVNKHLSTEGMSVAQLAPAGSILCTCIASIGKNTFTETTCGFNQQINALIPAHDTFDSYFLFFESALWSVQMKSNAASGTMQIVNKTEFSKLEAMIPSLPEQKIIGTFFSNLDSLITLHQRKYERLKRLKQALLRKMFV